MSDEVIDQAATQSMEDKILSRLGGLPTEPALETETVDDGLADLPWDGQTYRVPKPLKDAFMRNEDYTRKTQDLAEQRKSVEVVREIAAQKQLEGAFGETIAQESQELNVIDAYFKQVGQINWAGMTSEQMMRTKIEMDGIKDRRAALQQSIEAKKGAFHESMNQKFKELRGKARDIASKSIPGFVEQTEKEMTQFAVSQGLTEKEVDSVLLDPRSYSIVWKAMQFDKVQKGTGKAVESVTQVLRPGVASDRTPHAANAQRNFNKAMAEAKGSGEKARIIEQKLAGVFAKR